MSLSFEWDLTIVFAQMLAFVNTAHAFASGVTNNRNSWGCRHNFPAFKTFGFYLESLWHFIAPKKNPTPWAVK